MHFSNAPLKLFWKTYLLPANLSAFFYFLKNLLYILSVSALNYRKPLCHLHLLWKEVCALSFKKRQTPACCVGDRLKECQHKHSQTTCSPRAEGLASLQAHLHTIPQLSASEPRRQSGAKEGKEKGERKAFPDRENLSVMWKVPWCQWWKWWHLT